MDKLISKETESDFIKLGLYQVVGGTIGILLFYGAFGECHLFQV